MTSLVEQLKGKLSSNQVELCITSDRLSGNITVAGSILLNNLKSIPIYCEEVLSEHQISLINGLINEFNLQGKLSRTKHRQAAAILQKNSEGIQKQLKRSGDTYEEELSVKLIFAVKQAVKIEKKCIELMKEFNETRRRGDVIFVDNFNGILIG